MTSYSKRYRGFCGTLNNYSDEDLEKIRSSCEANLFKYFVAGLEVAPTTGTRHIQFYFQVEPRTLRSCVSFWNGTLGTSNVPHLEGANGTATQNRSYCVKDGNILIEHGKLPGRCEAKEDSLSGVIEIVKKGASMVEVAKECPKSVILQFNGISRLIAMNCVPRKEKTLVEWLFGPTGSGKSRAAWEEHPDAYSKDPNTKWWDGFHSQDTVILDDYRPSKELPFNQLLRLMDRYPLTVEMKGGSTNFSPRLIVVTTSKSIRETFANLDWLDNENLCQMERRVEYYCQFLPGGCRQVIWDHRQVLTEAKDDENVMIVEQSVAVAEK